MQFHSYICTGYDKEFLRESYYCKKDVPQRHFWWQIALKENRIKDTEKPKEKRGGQNCAICFHIFYTCLNPRFNL